MREIIIHYGMNHNEKSDTDCSGGAENAAISRKTGNTDGVYPTIAGDLVVTKVYEPPGLVLKGNPVGGEIFVGISHNPHETDADRRYSGCVEEGARRITIFAPEFKGIVPIDNPKLLPKSF